VLLVPFSSAWHRPSILAASRWPTALAVMGLGLLAGALARPERIKDSSDDVSHGYDIMLCLDLSGSMTWVDSPDPNQGVSRIDTIRPIVMEFIKRRPSDRIGMVVFGRRAYTLTPPTFDHDWILQQYSRMKIGIVDPAGTTIGDGIGMAINRLGQVMRQEPAGERGAFIVLLTDGGESMVNTANGPQPLSILPPLEAAQIAAARGIPIYTIAVGHQGYVWAPYYDGDKIATYVREVSDDLDPGLLQKVSKMTHGKYFRAERRDALDEAFHSIDQTKKVEFHARKYRVAQELFPWLAIPGVALLFGAMLLVRPIRFAREGMA
jgi:Ca-activated chloride channel family protein